MVYLSLSLKARQSSILWSLLCHFHSLCHCCHSLSLIAICCHSLYYSLSLFDTCCTTRCHLLSFVVTHCHSLSLVVPLVALVVIHCHSLSLDVPLACLFINDQSYVLKNEKWNLISQSRLVELVMLKIT